jgi:hypothetical protein
LRFPDQHFSVIVLANAADINANGLAYQLADLFLAGELAPLPPGDPAPPRPAGNTLVSDATAPETAPADLREYAGDYYSKNWR